MHIINWSSHGENALGKTPQQLHIYIYIYASLLSASENLMRIAEGKQVHTCVRYTSTYVGMSVCTACRRTFLSIDMSVHWNMT